MKLANVAVITADMNDFQCKEQYDKVISIEMFEHMKNYQVCCTHCARMRCTSRCAPREHFALTSDKM